LYHVSRAPFTSRQTIIDSSPIMENGSATRDTTPLYAGTAIELTLRARYAKHPTIRRWPRSFGKKPD
jgi:hypothetical protein